VGQSGYLPKLYEDARSEKYEKRSDYNLSPVKGLNLTMRKYFKANNVTRH